MILRRLALYFGLGAALFVALRLWAWLATPPPAVVARVPRDANAAAIAQAVEETLLLEEARRRGWDISDPIATRHLVRTMQFVEPELADDAEALNRAIALGMHQRDPVVRARLIYRARRALASVPRSDYPDRDELEAHLAAHPERFRRPERVRIEHVFFSATRRGDALEHEAREALGQLRAGATSEDLGDSLPDLRHFELTTVRALRNRFGKALADAVARAPSGHWLAPISSVYGQHLLRVTERVAAEVPPLDVIIEEVREDRLRELADEVREARLRALRERYEVRVERAG